MKDLAFSWFDAHNLTESEVNDFEYLSDILSNFEENEDIELDEDEIISIINEYQEKFLTK